MREQIFTLSNQLTLLRLALGSAAIALAASAAISLLFQEVFLIRLP